MTSAGDPSVPVVPGAPAYPEPAPSNKLAVVRPITPAVAPAAGSAPGAAANDPRWVAIRALRGDWSPSPIGEPTHLPTIIVSDRDLRDMTADAASALRQSNDPPMIFRRGTAFVRLRREGSDTHLEAMKPAAVRGRLARVADWRRVVGKDEELKAVAPPGTVVADLMTLPELPVPPLDRIVTAPVVAADGSVLLKPGYHPNGRIFYEPHPDLELSALRDRPSRRDVEAARDLLLEDLLGDFPFVGAPERAHALALLLGPFVRDLIAGSTPLHLIEAPSPGTGKGLLTMVVLLPAVGPALSLMTECRDEDEWRKRLTSKLLEGPAVVVVDNLSKPLDTPSLAAALTAPIWEDRVLGVTAMTRLPVRCVWVATGNNPVLSSEMTRRTVRIRLDAADARPWLRTTFRHADLRDWATRNRGRLVHAALTLVQAWLAAGRPPGAKTLGMYEDWSRTMGGILDVAGVPGFLGNLEEFYEAGDTECASWEPFVEAWWQRHGDQAVGVTDLHALADESQLDLGPGNDRSRRTRLGQALTGYRDRQVGELRIESAGKRQGAAQWRLRRRDATFTS